ncbi:MAG TPA: hypothetical protein VKP11_11460 [Frankiaceae bacterium]|nr:hypothetical protein [Frankiaceae bacterium]
MSALIYAAIVAMWAYFLVPMWLRRSDAASAEAASGGTASSGTAANDTASDDAEPAGAASELSPERSAGGEGGSASRSGSSPSARSHETSARSHERPAGMSSAPRPRRETDERLARRRSVLLGLLAAQVLTVAFGLAGALPAWTGLLVLAPLAAYVTHLRAEARRRAEQRAARPRVSADSTTPAPSPAPVARPADPREPQLFDLAAIEAAEAASRATLRPTVTGGTWDPVPVPPPTYVMKSRAQPPPSSDPAATDPARRRTPRSDGGGQHAVNH